MAVDEYPTREQVHEWLSSYDGQFKPTKRMKDFLEGKLTEAGLSNSVIPRHGKTVVDLILDDLPTYGF